MTLALAEYTVLDLTRARAGPTCVRQLADMGANDLALGPVAHLGGGNVHLVCLDLQTGTRVAPALERSHSGGACIVCSCARCLAQYLPTG